MLLVVFQLQQIWTIAQKTAYYNTAWLPIPSAYCALPLYPGVVWNDFY